MAWLPERRPLLSYSFGRTGMSRGGAGVVIKTTKVTGRRHLRFESLDAILADAECLAGVPTKQLGNWSLGQILVHLATVFEKSIDGTEYKPNWLARRAGRLFAPLWKRWVLRWGMPAGIRPPAWIFKEVAPPERVSTADGLAALRRAIGRLKAEGERDWAQSFGVFTRDEWDRFHMRHAELHLSYTVPLGDPKVAPAETAEPGAAAERPRQLGSGTS